MEGLLYNKLIIQIGTGEIASLIDRTYHLNEDNRIQGSDFDDLKNRIQPQLGQFDTVMLIYSMPFVNDHFVIVMSEFYKTTVYVFRRNEIIGPYFEIEYNWDEVSTFDTIYDQLCKMPSIPVEPHIL